MMDDMDTVGRYGTISLIRKATLTAVTSYPVDDERTTFGRDPKCSIRMYFHAVDPLHCTLIFEDGKAYLEVKGEAGITVDDAHVPYGVTVPLNNNSKFYIWRKLFQFAYPPRELRSQLLATPRSSRKSLRMSMIHSALILTPRNTASQTLDLRTLQSPLKPYKESPNEVVTFVESDQIAVVEDGPITAATVDDEAGSLVALEEVDVDESTSPDDEFSRTPIKRPAPHNPFAFGGSSTPVFGSPNRASNPSHRRSSSLANFQSPVSRQSALVYSPANSPARPLAPGRALASSVLVPRDQWRASGQLPPRTPPRRKANRMSMHKAVLVRSAHRAVIAAQVAKQEEEDEDEVVDAVSPERVSLSLQGDEEDGEGEDEYQEEQPGVASGGVIQAGVNLISSFSMYVRTSLSPERKTSSPSKADNNETEVEEGEVTEDDVTVSGLSRTSSDEDMAARASVALQISPVGEKVITEPASSPRGRGMLRFSLTPFGGWGTTKEKEVEEEPKANTGAAPSRLLGSFFTPQASRTLPASTNTVARDPAFASVSRLNSFFGKPVRPLRKLDLSVPLNDMEEAPVQETVQEDDEDVAMVDDEEDKNEKERRAERRRSAIAAMDVVPKPFANPSSRRRSAVFQSASKRRASLVDTAAPSVSLLESLESQDDESDISMSEGESPVAPPVRFEELKANVDRMRRESVVRAARHSLGAPVQPLLLNEMEGDVSQDLAELGKDSARRTSRSSDDSVEDAIEVDITDAEPMEDVVATVEPQEEEEEEEEENERTSPRRQRTNKRTAARLNASPQRSTRRKLDVAPESPTKMTTRRGKSATPAPPLVVDEVVVVAPQSTRPKRGASQDVVQSRTPSSLGRTTRAKSVLEPEEEVIPEVEEEEEMPVVEAPRSAPTKRPASRIATKAKTTPQTAPVKSKKMEEVPGGVKVSRRTAATKTTASASASAKTASVPAAEPKTATRARVQKAIPTPTAGPSASTGSKRAREPTETPAVASAGVRVKRSTRATPGAEDNADEVDDSGPRKRRKATVPAVKEEDVDEAPVKKTTTTSRVPTKRATAAVVVPATSTRRTPAAARNVSGEHDKENTPENKPGASSGPGKTSSSKATIASQGKAAPVLETAASRSLRSRVKK